MPADQKQLLACCQEVEKHFLVVGAQKCKSLTDNSQLSALLYLLLRSLSLFRSMIHLLKIEQLDALDSVRRSFLETWLLAFEFRMKVSAGKAAKWSSRQGGSWSADIKKLEDYSRSRNERVLKLGRYYGELSELAHPTRSAAENSTSLTAKCFGINTEVKALETAWDEMEKEMPELLYRLLWFVFDEDEAFISLNVNEKELPIAFDFVQKHPHL